MLWAEIVYWIGVLCATGCAYDLVVRRRDATLWRRSLQAFVLLFLSWPGIAGYLIFIRCRKTK